ncbi:hypothetical protein R3P38DRAFT_2760799 [Favolaschia claudopus]|uniref:Uncharacterized protein n=1 Tax=Favolaschia claudopus TaxID=2862362 RepID=A0AAW0DXS6_9AGAR
MVSLSVSLKGFHGRVSPDLMCCFKRTRLPYTRDSHFMRRRNGWLVKATGRGLNLDWASARCRLQPPCAVIGVAARVMCDTLNWPNLPANVLVICAVTELAFSPFFSGWWFCVVESRLLLMREAASPRSNWWQICSPAALRKQPVFPMDAHCNLRNSSTSLDTVKTGTAMLQYIFSPSTYPRIPWPVATTLALRPRKRLARRGQCRGIAVLVNAAHSAPVSACTSYAGAIGLGHRRVPLGVLCEGLYSHYRVMLISSLQGVKTQDKV